MNKSIQQQHEELRSAWIALITIVVALLLDRICLVIEKVTRKEASDEFQ